MTIKTKFNVGNYVYIIDGYNRLCKTYIMAILVCGRNSYRYFLTGFSNPKNLNFKSFEESELYKLKRDALKHKK